MPRRTYIKIKTSNPNKYKVFERSSPLATLYFFARASFSLTLQVQSGLILLPSAVTRRTPLSPLGFITVRITDLCFDLLRIKCVFWLSSSQF